MTANITCAEDILKLGMKESVSLARNWDVSVTGLRTLAEIHQILITRLPPSESKTPDPVIGLDKEQQTVRNNLLTLYQKADDLHADLTDKIKENLNTALKDIEISFKERQQSLASGECTIVVAGEVGAGKTSLINLLLGTQLFPTDALKCTNTICEIRASGPDRKEAIIFHKRQLTSSNESDPRELTNISESDPRNRRVAPKVISLRDLRGIQEFKDCVSENDDNDENQYERIEVFYPFQSLSKGVVIIDTPGVEGGSNVDQRLQKYLCKAFGFIYVINTNTAGGVQHGRLGHLLKTVVNSCEEFSPDTSLFIANKWEHIPDSDKAAVQEDIFQKLSRVYPGIKQKQVQYMSVTKAYQMAMQHKCRLKEHELLIANVTQELIPNSLRQGMVSHYWWLSAYLTRAAYLIRVSSVQHAMTEEELKKQREELKNRIEELQKNTDTNLNHLKEKVEFEIYKITNALKEVLRSRDMLDRLCNWEDKYDCPSVHKKWKHTADDAAVKISDRVTRLVDNWQKENGVLSLIDNEIISVFTKEMGLMEHQVRELEAILSKNNQGTSATWCKTIRTVPVKGIFAGKKKKLEKTYSTLGGAVSCAGMLDTSAKKVKRIFDDYNDKNKCKKMAEATIVYLNTIVQHKDLGQKLKKFFERFFKDIDEAANRLPGFLQADEELLNTLHRSVENQKRWTEKMPKLEDSSTKLLSKLDICYINNIKKFDFDLSEIDWEKRKRIGSGSFADVFEAFIRQKKRPVALKVSKDPARKSNVTDILTEDRIMRDLHHVNVVRYYGSAYYKSEKGLHWIMVMELCGSTLKDIYTGDHRNDSMIPGLQPNGHPRAVEAGRSVIQHGLQIARGLEYIHEKGYTHRDMKLENVLVNSANEVKITDVGVAKSTNLLVCTLKGSPAYMAPEILLNIHHSNKVDIYSFSIMLWEMWFGKDISVVMDKEVLGYEFHGDAISVLKEKVAKASGGFRPPFKAATCPPESMIRMMQRGWDFDPISRPTAKEMAKVCQDLISNNLI